MTDSLTTAKAVFEADSANLVVLATGGIYDFDETGRMGINRTNAATAAAFASGIIQPCIMLKLASSVPFGGIADDIEQVISVRDMLEVWAYQDNSYSTIKSMLARSYTLLQGKRLGSYRYRFAQKVQPPVRDLEMDANVEIDRYEVIYLKQ